MQIPAGLWLVTALLWETVEFAQVHFSVCFSLRIWTEVVCTEGAEASLPQSILPMSSRTAHHPAPGFSHQHCYTSQCSGPGGQTQGWRPLTLDVINAKWHPNVKNCGILPVTRGPAQFWTANHSSSQDAPITISADRLRETAATNLSGFSASTALTHPLYLLSCVCSSFLCASSSYSVSFVGDRGLFPGLPCSVTWTTETLARLFSTWVPLSFSWLCSFEFALYLEWCVWPWALSPCELLAAQMV